MTTDELRAPGTDDEEPWPLYPEPRRSWLSRLIAAIRRRLA